MARLHLASGCVSVFATGLAPISGLAFASDGSLLVLGAYGLYRITPP